MNKTRFTLKACAFLVFTLAFASAAHAQATRSWAPGAGDDANPCSRTAPCKTFAGAIPKTADGGEIDCIDPGGFGTVTITKSITIDGNGTFASILAAGTNGVNVNDSASGAANTHIVRLRNLSINGAGTGFSGINFTSAKQLYIENCQVFGFRGNGTNSHALNINLNGNGVNCAAHPIVRMSDSNIYRISAGLAGGGTYNSVGNNHILGNTSDVLTPGITQPK